MSKHQPYGNINKFLITERSLNYILRPVQVRFQNYPYTYSIENMDEAIEKCAPGVINRLKIANLLVTRPVGFCGDCDLGGAHDVAPVDSLLTE